jgi:hypothetical protein
MAKMFEPEFIEVELYRDERGLWDKRRLVYDWVSITVTQHHDCIFKIELVYRSEDEEKGEIIRQLLYECYSGKEKAIKQAITMFDKYIDEKEKELYGAPNNEKEKAPEVAEAL